MGRTFQLASPDVEFEIVASGLQFPEGPIAMPDGSLLFSEIYARKLSRLNTDGTVEHVADIDGQPDGAAIGPDGAVYVCNNGGSFAFERSGDLLLFGLTCPLDYSGGSIDRVDLETGRVEKLYTHCGDLPLRGPNDIVFDTSGGFWFTDHGIRTARSSDRSSVFYAKPDGSFIEEKIFPLDEPNGIALSPDGGRLYVAETQVGRLWVYELSEPGVLAQGFDSEFHSGQLVYGAGGYRLFDSMAVDSAGWICQGTLGDGAITHISPDGKVASVIRFSDPCVTNLCFGGPDLQTAFITCSASGNIVAVKWPRPGLRLAF